MMVGERLSVALSTYFIGKIYLEIQLTCFSFKVLSTDKNAEDSFPCED